MQPQLEPVSDIKKKKRDSRLMERALDMNRSCSDRKRNANETATGNSHSLARRAALFMLSCERHALLRTHAVRHGLHERSRARLCHTASFIVPQHTSTYGVDMCGIYHYTAHVFAHNTILADGIETTSVGEVVSV